MGFRAIKSSIKVHRFALLFVCVLVLSMIKISSGGTASGSGNNKPIDCRIRVFHPKCRGVAAAKRDTGRFTEDYRFPQLEREISGLDRPLNEQINSRTLLGELLRKAIDDSTEYDNANYLK